MPDFQVMGVVNTTPDSFSDGGLFLAADAAIEHGLRLAADGADIVDVGGESTRPGADVVPEALERERVEPVVRALTSAGVRVSVDTSKVAVAEAALRAGASYVNDVTAFRAEPELADLVADARVECCVMHMLGDPRTMQRNPRYDDIVDDIRAFLEERVEFAVRAGIAEERITIDPGIGFGKTVDHNLELLRRIGEFRRLGRPVLLGTSRKSFLGRLTGRPEHERAAATAGTCVLGLLGGASVFRVHDVREVVDALTVAAATVSGRWVEKTIPTSTRTTS